jgi:hypothetical protein
MLREIAMKIFRVLFLLFAVLVVGLPMHALPVLKTQRAKYEALAGRLRAGDYGIDWRALRIAAELGNVTGGYRLRDTAKRALAAMQTGNYADALRLAREMQAHNVADAEGHSLAAAALEHLGREPEARQERAMVNALTYSILKSGDGKTAATAYFTVNSREEYMVMRQLLLVTPTAQRLEHVNGHDYDVIAGKNAAGRAVTLWFNSDTNIQKVLDAKGENVDAVGDPNAADPAEPEDNKAPN